MFDVYYYSEANAERQLLHSATGTDNKILSGTISEALNTVTTFDFTIGINNSLYNMILPFKGLIQVINRNTMEEVFYGRILKPKGAMSSGGLFTQSYIAEDPLSFLNDSTQSYARLTYHSEEFWLQELVYNHNLQVEPYKQFIVGTVDVEDVEKPTHHYWGQESTFDELKRRHDKLGGYIQVTRDGDFWRIDWTKEVGEYVDEPIELGKNMKSATRTNSFENMITRLVPLGHENGIPWSDNDAVTQRLELSNLNGGERYIDDIELINQFGIIQRPIVFDEIRQEQALLDAGQNFLDYQHKYLTSWEVEVVDLSLIDPSKQGLVVGNTYPVNNPPIASVESQQIVSKTTNVLSPQAPTIKLGSIERSISSYYNQMQMNIKALSNITAKKVGESDV